MNQMAIHHKKVKEFLDSLVPRALLSFLSLF